MNTKFYTALSDMKTTENASILEAVKGIYVLCEGVKNPLGSNAFLSEAKAYLEQQSAVHPGFSVSNNTVCFDTDNGKARIVVADFENATIEVSPLAESQFYPIGTTKLTDGLGSAYTMAVDAINDEAMMEGILSKFMAPALVAGSMALNACSNAPKIANMPDDPKAKKCVELVTELGITPTIDGNTVSVTSDDFSTMIGNLTNNARLDAKERLDDPNTTYEQFNSLEGTRSLAMAKFLREMLDNKDIQVVGETAVRTNEGETTDDAYNRNAINALDKEFDHLRTSMKLKGTSLN